ncbi:type VII secretion integral membrane protein EccD [Mycobacterium sp. SM1]|uniref:type VII secretion integral membrane protein EccD n=1 Tax=Mycobacterium sp. SM1 TaxID=2816243 RepID=UPI001BD00CD0|nr:type VII secretion integral membrane protein EccD [Mycobacterium sp. SM1]MBS4728893.1 type VII secretion integral membrane protein EccD [Mycobacterium sp. SM1]
MSDSDRCLRRVSVYADAVQVDLALPAAVPVAVLIPAIVDILAGGDGRGTGRPAEAVPAGYQLSRPGVPALDASATLAQSGVRDGAVLVLTRCTTELPAPRFDDAAEAVGATLKRVAHPWTRRTGVLTAAVSASWLAGSGALVLIRNAHAAAVPVAATAAGVALLGAVWAQRAYRQPVAALTLGLLAVGFSAVAGFLAVPGNAGAPKVLLAAPAGTLAAVATIRAAGCGTLTLTAIGCFAALMALTALAGVLTAAPPAAVGSLLAVISLALLEVAPRASIMLAGLAPRLPGPHDAPIPSPDPDSVGGKAIRADTWLTSLTAAFSASAAADAIVVGVDHPATPRCSGIAFTGLVGAALLLRARAQVDPRRILVLVGAALAAISATLAGAAAGFPRQAVWIGAAALMLAGFPLALGPLTAAITASPVARRAVELAEYLLLAALVPMVCWIWGVYDAARGLNLR